MSNLNLKAWLWLIYLALVMALLLFAPAGTLRYWQAWVYLVVFFAISALTTLDLMKNDPALLRRRMRGGPGAEKEASQKIIMLFALIGFDALLVVPALDRRFHWSDMPVPIVIAGDLLTIAGFAIIFLVYRENSFASATIEVAPDQRVIATGPYAIVRHPMYAGALLYLLAMPLALGSWWALLIVATLAPFIVWRLIDEERFLAARLPGYAQYRAKIRWRLIPGIF
jgi:protein-S-isoprenylcysteine O-methyltransferase Ste14